MDLPSLQESSKLKGGVWKTTFFLVYFHDCWKEGNLCFLEVTVEAYFGPQGLAIVVEISRKPDIILPVYMYNLFVGLPAFDHCLARAAANFFLGLPQGGLLQGSPR